MKEKIGVRVFKLDGTTYKYWMLKKPIVPWKTNKLVEVWYGLSIEYEVKKCKLWSRKIRRGQITKCHICHVKEFDLYPSDNEMSLAFKHNMYMFFLMHRNTKKHKWINMYFPDNLFLKRCEVWKFKHFKMKNETHPLPYQVTLCKGKH